MTTHQRPFLGGSTEVSILEAVRQGEIAPPRSINRRIPESLENVVLKALAKDADEGYQGAGGGGGGAGGGSGAGASASRRRRASSRACSRCSSTARSGRSSTPTTRARES